MSEIEVVMKHEKETKRTERYMEVVEYGEQPLIGSLYIQKSAFKDDGKYPEQIRVAVEWD